MGNDIVTRLLGMDGMTPFAKTIVGEAANEIARLRAGLELIQEAGAVHGAAWCVTQARGHLEDLDFDQFPENGKNT